MQAFGVYRFNAALPAVLLSLISPAGADALQPPSISLDEYAYPSPVDYLTVTVEKQELRMAVIIRAMFETGAVR